jgi:hypothetical protein
MRMSLFSTIKNSIEPDREFYDIQIRGDEEFTTRILASLELLRDIVPERYYFVRQNIGIIRQVERGSGIRLRTPIPMYSASKQNAVMESSKKRRAADMMHEAWHSYLYHTWLKNHPEATDTDYVTWMKETLEEQEKECTEIQFGTLVLLKASPIEMLQTRTALKSRYWEVPMEKRWW